MFIILEYDKLWGVMFKERCGDVLVDNALGKWLDLRDPEVFLGPQTDLERLRLLERCGLGEAAIRIIDVGEEIEPFLAKGAFGGLVTSCRDYLELPTFIDHFQFHDRRREWRRLIEKLLGEDYRRAIERNRFRLNHFFAISTNLLALTNLIGSGRVTLPRKSRMGISRFNKSIREHCIATHYYHDLGVGYKVMLSQTTAEACRKLLTDLNLG